MDENYENVYVSVTAENGTLDGVIYRVLDMPRLSADATQLKQPKLSEEPMRQIDAPREPVSSVTENTTRAFEPIHRERDTQR